jgi:hypothetical protein
MQLYNKYTMYLLLINTQCTIYANCPKKVLERENCTRPWWAVRIESAQIRWFSGQSAGKLDIVRSKKRHNKLN